MQALTFDQLPNAVERLFIKMESIEKLLCEKAIQQQPVEDRWLNLNEFCEYHPDKPAKATVYGWVFRYKVPHHKDGKKLRFLKSEIDLWLQSGKIKTQTEIAAEAASYVKSKRRA